MNDTPKEIAEMVRGKLLARSGAERVLMGSRMFDVARAIVLASLPPGLSEIEMKGRLCERLYGDEVDVEAFVRYLRSSRQAREAGFVAPPSDEMEGLSR